MEEKNTKEEKLKILLNFLERTKEGKYAPIDDVFVKIKRVEEETITISDEYEYYYGIY